ncbi:hypothetical protein TNCV_4024131 [Trichonephila clavipes]|nr:hypothetical protein TNCV_4024131 [Trichonephila clavipes]
MTSVRGHGAIVYCLNSGSEDRQTGRHNSKVERRPLTIGEAYLKIIMSSFSIVLCEGDTRNRWRDGQVCPDVRQGTMAPWARRLGGEKSRENGRKIDEKSREKKDREETERELGRERAEPALYGEKG